MSNTLTIAHADDIRSLDLERQDWSRARPIEITRYWSGDEAPPRRHAEVRLLWSEKALFARFLCNQTEPLVVSGQPNLREKTMNLWDRDVCEIFLANHPYACRRYFEFEAAPTGEWIDVMIDLSGPSRKPDWQFRSGMSTSANVGEGSVTIAMRIPWDGLGAAPKPGDKWRGNLFRCVGSGAERGYLSWQATRTPKPNFHVPEAFGYFRFEA